MYETIGAGFTKLGERSWPLYIDLIYKYAKKYPHVQIGIYGGKFTHEMKKIAKKYIRQNKGKNGEWVDPKFYNKFHWMISNKNLNNILII